MGYSALERLLVPERYRQRAANTGFAAPLFQEIQLEEGRTPLLALNMSSTFLSVRRAPDGRVRYGFSPCMIEEEGTLLTEFHRVLTELSIREGWSNRCTSIEQSLERLRELGHTPNSVVLTESFLTKVLGDGCNLEEARRAMKIQGYVAMVDGMQVLLGDLPDGLAFVAAAPQIVGSYTRVGDHLGLLFQQVDRAIVVVKDDVA